MALPPCPGFERKAIRILDGSWDFAFDPDDIGLHEGWKDRTSWEMRINVPFPVESSLSGVANAKPSGCEVYWYSTSVTFDPVVGKRTFLCFNAVDYKATVFIDGVLAADHIGGYSYFDMELPNRPDEPVTHRITVRVEDRNNPTQVRGKQYWHDEASRCWYKPTSGIWQPVWLEERGQVFIKSVLATPDIDKSRVELSITLSDETDETLSIKISKDGQVKAEAAYAVHARHFDCALAIGPDDFIDDIHLWSPENPQLYQVSLELGDDSVMTWFGMRKIEARDGQVLLNNRPYYQRLVLDQAYFEKGICTAQDEEDFIRDIKLVKSLGFNGVRLHQKIEDPRFYHLCDKLGLIVWLEMPSMYSFSLDSSYALLAEWKDIVIRHYNHPSIVTYVPLNESWGVRNIFKDEQMQEFSLALYHLTRTLDRSRLISTNDGWEQTHGDISAIHDYCQDGSGLKKKLDDIARLVKGAAGDRMLYCDKYQYTGQPVFITEFGGVAFSKDTDSTNWGYGDGEEDEESFLARISSLVKAIVGSGATAGFCYTQLTDVYQEVNGLATMERKLKCDKEKLRQAISYR